MSQKELQRVKVIENAAGGRLSPAPRLTAQKPKIPMLRIYNLGGRPALAQLLNR